MLNDAYRQMVYECDLEMWQSKSCYVLKDASVLVDQPLEVQIYYSMKEAVIEEQLRCSTLA
jgi:hypothetical protein